MTKPSAGQLLQQYIADHEKNVESFAKAIGVGTASVYRWFDTHGPRSNVVRVVIEMRTKGKIKAEMWPMPGSRWNGAATAAKKKKIAKKLVNKNSKKKNSKKIVKTTTRKKVALSESQKRAVKKFLKAAKSDSQKRSLSRAIRTARSISKIAVDRVLRRERNRPAALRKALADIEAAKKAPPTPPAAAI